MHAGAGLGPACMYIIPAPPRRPPCPCGAAGSTSASPHGGSAAPLVLGSGKHSLPSRRCSDGRGRRRPRAIRVTTTIFPRGLSSLCSVRSFSCWSHASPGRPGACTTGGNARYGRRAAARYLIAGTATTKPRSGDFLLLYLLNSACFDLVHAEFKPDILFAGLIGDQYPRPPRGSTSRDQAGQ